MRRPHPRQDQEPCVVGDQADVPLPRVHAPADIAVAAAQMARRRTPCQARDRPPLRPYQILQMLANRLLVTEVMMLLHQAVEQRLVARSPDLLQFNGPQFVQRLRSSASCRSTSAPAAHAQPTGFVG